MKSPTIEEHKPHANGSMGVDFLNELREYSGKAKSEPVIFRKYSNGEIIALFPNISDGVDIVRSYLHVGQHGAADYSLVISKTKPAKPAEYKELKEELESIGYDLRVMQRRPKL